MTMIKSKTVKVNGQEFIYTYSDSGYFITDSKGYKYIDAYDLLKYPKVYTETNELIKREKNND